MYWVKADSSDFTTGATLSQQSLKDGKWHPIAFLSKSLSPVKRNYEIHDKEMITIIRALEEWWHFLEGPQLKFKIWMDHKNLECLLKKLNQRQAHWSLYLSQFDSTLHPPSPTRALYGKDRCTLTKGRSWYRDRRQHKHDTASSRTLHDLST